jgi:Phospholipase_D-nuclease N-terminal
MQWWQILLIVAIAAPLIMLWVACFIDILTRADLGTIRRVLWAFFIIITPLIGALFYVLLRPKVIVPKRRTVSRPHASVPRETPAPATAAGSAGSNTLES